MAIIASDSSKVFELPPNGQYIGVIADVHDLGVVPDPKFGPKRKVQIIWVLGLPTGGYALDSQGGPYQVSSQVPVSMHEKSTLYKMVRSILDAAPPAGDYDVEQLLGRSNMLFVVQEKNAAGTKTYANIKGIVALPAGVGALPIPQGFIRRKDRPVRGQTAPGSPAPAPTQQAPFVQAQQPQQQQGQTQQPVQQAVQQPVVLDKAF